MTTKTTRLFFSSTELLLLGLPMMPSTTTLDDTVAGFKMDGFGTAMVEQSSSRVTPKVVPHGPPDMLDPPGEHAPRGRRVGRERRVRLDPPARLLGPILVMRRFSISSSAPSYSPLQ